MKKWLSLWMIVIFAFVPAFGVYAQQTAVLALGADLSADQRAVVLSEMGITEEEAASYQTVYITNEMEHQYLDSSLGASVVGHNERGNPQYQLLYDRHVPECPSDGRSSGCEGDRGRAQSGERNGSADRRGKGV